MIQSLQIVTKTKSTKSHMPCILAVKNEFNIVEVKNENVVSWTPLKCFFLTPIIHAIWQCEHYSSPNFKQLSKPLTTYSASLITYSRHCYRYIQCKHKMSYDMYFCRQKLFNCFWRLNWLKCFWLPKWMSYEIFSKSHCFSLW